MTHRPHARTAKDFELESLSDAVTHLLEECRMVLPGIQALFGFQLIAAFSQAFWDKLEEYEQVLHYLSILLVAGSIALVMTPAAYHRCAAPRSISNRLIILSTRVLSWSMYPLMLAIAVEIYLIGRVILQHWGVSLLISLLLMAMFGFLWRRSHASKANFWKGEQF